MVSGSNTLIKVCLLCISVFSLLSVLFLEASSRFSSSSKYTLINSGCQRANPVVESRSSPHQYSLCILVVFWSNWGVIVMIANEIAT